MKWVVLAIAAMILPYTWVTLKYRKENRPFEPYHDMKSQANVQRLREAGFQRIQLRAERPADATRNQSLPPPSTLQTVPGGLPPSLRQTLIDVPVLANEISHVHAADSISALLPYSITLTASLPDEKGALGGAYLYRRESELVILPQFERLEGELLARTRTGVVELTVPAGALPAGVYSVLVVGSAHSKSWSLEIR